MLRKEINDLLTQTGGSTPMGSMFRQYWIPALLASELPKDDCPPVRVKLLSERLIAFRDSKGRYGLMDEFCAHRTLGVSEPVKISIKCPAPNHSSVRSIAESALRTASVASNKRAGRSQRSQ